MTDFKRINNTLYYATISWLVVFLHFSLEHLFFATKPSAMSTLSWSEQIKSILIAPAPCALFLLVLFIVFDRLSGLFPSIWRFADLIIAVQLAILNFILIDNFTYTLFLYKSTQSVGVFRFLYKILYILLLVLNYRFIKNKESLLRRTFFQRIIYFFIFSQIVFFVIFSESTNQADERSINRKYNIVILSSDGMEANMLSLYGYSLRTTPFLDSIRDELYVISNHYSNSGLTTGSMTSMLSGKLPTENKVNYRPDILYGKNSHEHLPGILKNAGYETGEFTMRHYVDSQDLNFRNAFDYANGRSLKGGLNILSDMLHNHATSYYMNQKILHRIYARMLELIHCNRAENPYLEFSSLQKSNYLDNEREADYLKFFSKKKQPFFANIHLMNTHKNYLKPTREKDLRFGIQEKDVKNFRELLYADAVYEYDQRVKKLYEVLSDDGVLDRTIVVFTSDHSRGRLARASLPLAIRFPPELQKVGGFSKLNQRIDIAPTLLSALGIDKPLWMEGQSLIGENYQDNEVLLSTTTTDFVFQERGWANISPFTFTPPFYSIHYIGAIHCGYVYYYNLKKNTVWKKPSFDKPLKCKNKWAEKKIYKYILEHLQKKGYKTGSLTAHLGK